MAISDRRRREGGYTLAALLVILSVLAVVVAYTVPRQWSDVMRREREIQTLWTMKQYARAIQEFQRKRGALPVSLEQLAEQKQPRILRQLYPDPLTGKLDWILVPAGSPTPAQTVGTAPPGMPQPPPGTTPGPVPPPPVPGGGDPSKQVGPFIGVRPPVTGESFLIVWGAETYETWMYTINELQREAGGTPNIPYQTVPKTPRPRP